MAQGEFLWCDLATFDVDETLKYYRNLFGWDMKPEEFPDGSTYYYASGDKEVTAGIYEMPAEYRAENMPSFWMSYIGVDDIIESCSQVAELGGKVLLGPASFGKGAAIAMIEDPFGARFTFLHFTWLEGTKTRCNRQTSGEQSGWFSHHCISEHRKFTSSFERTAMDRELRMPEY